MAASAQHSGDGTFGEHGVVAEWYREDGVLVSQDAPLCRVTVAGSDLEITAPARGHLQHVVPLGSAAAPGDVLAMVLPPGLTGDGSAAPPAAVRMPAIEAPRPPVGAGSDSARPDEFLSSAPAPGEPVVVPFRPRLEASLDGAASTPAEPAGRVDRLPEPGAGIPGLPLWDDGSSTGGSLAGPGVSARRYPAAFLAGGGAAQQDVISIAANFAAAEAGRFVNLLVAAWSDPLAEPGLEDVLLATIARALFENGYPPSHAGLVIAGQAHDTAVCIAEPVGDLRRAARARNRGGDDEFEHAAWVLVSLAALGVESVEPRLDQGRPVGFGMGSPVNGVIRVTMRFDSARISEGDAGRVLARARTLFEFPYAMLV